MSEEQYEAICPRVCSPSDVSYNTEEDQIMVREDVARDLITMTGGTSEPEAALTRESLQRAIHAIQDMPGAAPAMDRWQNETLYGTGLEAVGWPEPDFKTWDGHHLSPVDIWHA